MQIYSKSITKFLLILVFITALVPSAPMAFAEELEPVVNIENLDPTILIEPTVEPSDQTQEFDPKINPQDIGESLSEIVGESDKNDETKEPEEEFDFSPSYATATTEEGMPNEQESPRLHPEIDEFTGALTYSYDLFTPAGRNGIQPSLALTYNSGNEAKDSIFGFGWSLNIPSIERINRDGTDQLYDQADYSSSLSGELIALSSTTYAAKSEKGDFLTYEKSGNSWLVTDKSGTVYTFGASADERQDDPSDDTRVYKWMLSEVRDTNDNYITYEYRKVDGQILPLNIYYTGHGSTDGIYQVSFGSSTSSDGILDSSRNFEVEATNLTSVMNVTINGVIARHYELTYAVGSNGDMPILESILETGRTDEGDEVTLPLTTFTYQAPDEVFELAEDWDMCGFTDGDTARVDVNGDGLVDCVVMELFSLSSAPSTPNESYGVFMNTGTSWEFDTDWDIPVNGYTTYSASNVIFADFTGDGLVDMYTLPSGPFYENTGSEWATSSTWYLPSPVPSSYASYSLNDNVVIDVNGDGLLDLVFMDSTEPSGDPSVDYNYQVFLNTGSAWELDTSWTMPIHPDGWGFTFDEDYTNLYGDFFDINGDGLPDFVWQEGVFLNTGEGWEEDLDWDMPGYMYRSWSYYDIADTTHNRFLDVNGDGLVDFVVSDSTVDSSGQYGVYLNTGAGWELDTSWTLPSYLDSSGRTAYWSFSANYSRIGDFTGDGLPDFLLIMGETAYDALYVNTGTTWVQDTAWTLPVAESGFGYSFDPDGYSLLDVDANGLEDYLVFSEEDEGSITGDPTTDVYYRLFLNEGKKGDRLSTISLSSGATIDVNYEQVPILDSNPYSQTQTFYAVSDLTKDDGLGSTSTSTYEYTDGKYYAHDEQYRSFTGFGSVTVTDDEGNTRIVYNHQGNDSETSLGEYSDAFSKIGLPYRTEVYDELGQLYRVNIQKWDEADLGDGRAFAKLVRSTTLSYDGLSTHQDSASEYTYDDSTGNLTSQINYGEVTAADDGSYTDTGSDTQTMDLTYAVDSTEILRNKPASQTLTNNAGTTVSETQYNYDSLSHGSVSTGNLTQESTWISGTSYASTSYTYDAYGNIETSTDPNGNETSYAYDAYDLYVDSSENAKGQVTSIETDYASGKTSSQEDPNGNTIETDYDGLGRPTEQRSTDESGALVTARTWSYDYTSNPRKITTLSYFSSTLYAENLVYLDGFGRTIETKILDEDGTGYYETETSYDSLGRVSGTTLPEESASSAYDANTVSSALAETYEYDVLGRITQLTNALGDTDRIYEGFTVSVYDPIGNRKDYTTDAYDRLVNVVEYLDGSAYTTVYTWTAHDKLESLTDALGNVRNFTYDGRGLRLTAQDLHAPSDATFGTWTSSYDTAGNLYTALSPVGTTVTYTYDELNRVLTEDASDEVGTEVTYTYDSCTNGETLLCSVENAASETTYTYWENGRVNVETTVIDGVTYTSSSTSDYQGNPLTLTHPDGTLVRNTYNALGKLETVEEKTPSDADYVYVITDSDYGPHGQITSETYANGAVSTSVYDELERYRLRNKASTGYVQTVEETVSASEPVTVSYNSAGGDGYTYRTSTSWDTAHDATTAGLATSTGINGYSGTGKSGSSYAIYRAFFPFDTSSLPDDATVTGATLKLFTNSGNLDNDNDAEAFMTVVQSSQASTSALVTADFDNAGAVDNPSEGLDEADRVDITGMTANVYANFELNSTGQSWVSTTGATLLAVREGHDVLDSAFTASSSTALYDRIMFRTSEYSGTSSDPILEVTYTVPEVATATVLRPATLQDLTYTYDSVGNITSIVDASESDSAKTTDYIYDDLYRLTSAAVSGAASGTDETISYTFNILGNLLTRSDEGSYTYDGATTEGSYANPHAVTSITKTDGEVETFEYNEAGAVSLISTTEVDGEQYQTAFTWDYAGRMTERTRSEGSVTSSAPTTVSFYSSAGDGYALKTSSSWDTAHDASTAGTANSLGINGYLGTGKYSATYTVSRGFFPFDTSSLPDDATVTAAQLKLYSTSNNLDNDNDGDDFITVVQSSQASASTLATSDFDNAGSVDAPTEGLDVSGRVDITSLVANTYTSFYLNSTGLAWVSNLGNTLLALREGHDVLDTAFTPSSASSQYDRLFFRTSEYAGTSSDPILLVTYTTPVVSYAETASSTYAYNAAGQRVSKTSTEGTETSTVLYPSAGYEVEGSEKTIYVNGPQGSSATIHYDGASYAVSSNHQDHLGSTAVVTDSSGGLKELLDYNPYGTERLHTGASSTAELPSDEAQKTYIGEYSDDDSGLSYLNARYYDAARGQFLSEDPLFLRLGSGTDKREALLLADPQSQNSYSYARGNPIGMKDPTGELSTRAAIAMVFFQPLQVAYAAGQALAYGLHWSDPVTSSFLDHSLSLNPGAVTINENNQSDWGNVIDAIQNTDEFSSKISDLISTAEMGGQTSINENKGLQLNETSDLKMAIGTAQMSVQGSQMEDGSWDLNVNIIDTYHFEQNLTYNSGTTYDTMNQVAAGAQDIELISKFDETINFDYHHE